MGSDGVGDGFAKWFPNRDSFEQFKAEWALLKDRPGLNREAALVALAFAAFHASVERDYQAAANQVRMSRGGTEFPARARKIRKALKDLLDEIKGLTDESEILGGDGQLDKVLQLQISRGWFKDGPAYVDDEAAAEDESDEEAYALLRALTAMSPDKTWLIQRGPLLASAGSVAFALVPAMENYFQFASRVLVILAEMEVILRRPEGSQAKPWSRRALEDLTKAGLTKGEADGFLRIMGLKGDNKES
jgi:hypothetical protein